MEGVHSISTSSKIIRQPGFTLIELLIVIAIILILISIALPNFLEAQIRAKVARVQGDIRSISIGQHSYYLDRKVYTDDCGGGSMGCLQSTTPVKYMATIPFDPFGAHKYGSGWNYLLDQKKRAFYPMGTGTWGSNSYVKSVGAMSEAPAVRDAYIIYSAGPTSDQMEPGGPTGLFPQPQTSCAWIKYSPTNGTQSFGGIMRVGGSLPPAYKHLQIGQ